jgi:hypothetical protein
MAGRHERRIPLRAPFQLIAAVRLAIQSRAAGYAAKLAWLQEQLGHSDVRLPRTTYGQ